MKTTKLIILSLLLLLAGFSTTWADQPRGALWAISDGQGTVSLFWIPKNLTWPSGGWQLDKIKNGKATTLKGKLGPGLNQAAMNRLLPKDRTTIDTFSSELKSGAIPREEREIAFTVMGLSAAFDPDFGLALGLRYQDSDPKGGKRTYRLTALNSKGQKQSVMTSPAVDPSKPTPLPETPRSFKATPNEAGVDLTWENPKQNPSVPVFAFEIERQDATGGKILLTGQPLLITEAQDLGVHFVDLAPPKETEASYHIYSLDLFGRRSKPLSRTLFIPDLSALYPPARFGAEAGDNQVELSWLLNESPFTSGYVIERALLRQGPYTTLTPDGLDAEQDRWTDSRLLGGTTYFYRIRAMDPRGNLGKPSLAASAIPRNRQAPPRPDNLQAEVGRTRVRLTWDAVKFPVAGYKIERFAKEAKRWTILTSGVVPEARYDDQIQLHTQGEFRYRVTAVAFDNQESKPSREVKALLLDTVSPNPPRIIDINGSDGKVVISFKATPPEGDIKAFLVVRSVAEDDPGLVIGDPLPVGKKRFEDTFVDVGRKYWYRLVAVDASGNRSDPSWTRQVTVLNPPIPVPGKPSLKVEEEPLRHVRISFKTPPPGLEVIIQRLEDGQGWRPLTGGISDASEAADLNPPRQDKIQYRILYRAANGVAGKPSPAAEAKFKK